MSKKKKIRVQFTKNRENRTREGDLTRQFRDAGEEMVDQGASVERVRARGDLSRKRTIVVEGDAEGLAVNQANALRGRVLMVTGLYCTVVGDDGQSYRCFVRRLIKSMKSEARSVLAPGDWVWFRPAANHEGLILRVEPRHHLMTRVYRGREHLIAVNVDQVLIVSALINPGFKLQLIDRYLVTAEHNKLRPLICFNKVDLADAAAIEPLIGLYSQLGYTVVLTSTRTGQGVDQLREQLAGRETVIVGQSGVGKSSLLNALRPEFHLRVSEVSEANEKGRHTTTTSQLLRLENGSTVIDTPGIRQFELADISAGELEGYFIEFRPFAARCRFPGCTHTHENDCAVKNAVSDYLISLGRYENYQHILAGEPA